MLKIANKIIFRTVVTDFYRLYKILNHRTIARGWRDFRFGIRSKRLVELSAPGEYQMKVKVKIIEGKLK